MKKIFVLLCLAVASMTQAYNCCCYEENPRCLPPLECDENLFPRCKSIFGSVDFLYWNVAEGALDYAVKMKCPGYSATIGNDFANGKVKNGCFDWKPGVRVALGYYNAPRLWSLTGEYTYYHSSGKDSTCKPCEEDLFLTGTFPQLSRTLQSASSSLDLHYHLGEALFARVFDPNPHLRLNLFAGASGVYLKQDWDVKYCDDEDEQFAIGNDWSYKAGGLRIGLSADWWWKWSLYLTGKASFGGFVGCYKNKATEFTTIEGVGFNPELPLTYICYEDTRFAPHFQFLFGPSWGCVGKCFYYNVFVGYEINGWLNLQETNRSSSGVPESSKLLFTRYSALGLHGLTARLTLGF